MMDVTHTTYGEWTDYLETGKKIKMYKCPVCKSISGKMKTRIVTEPAGGSHKEYKVVCNICGHKCGAFWSKILAERTWEAENDPYWDEQKRFKNIMRSTPMIEIKLENGRWVVYHNKKYYGSFNSMAEAAAAVDNLRTGKTVKGDAPDGSNGVSSGR